MKIINKPIFKVSIRNNWKVTVIHLIIGIAFLALMRLVIQFFNIDGADKESFGYLILYQTANMFSADGNLGILALVFLTIVGGGFINRPAIDGSLSTYLTVSISRKNYAITTILAYCFIITALIAAFALAGLLTMFSFFDAAAIKAVYVVNYFAVVGVFALVTLTIAAISYFAATLFAGTKVKGMYVLIPILFFIVASFAAIGSMVKELEFMRYLTPYSWFNLTYLLNRNIDARLTDIGGITAELFGNSVNWWDKNPWLPAVLCLVIIAACFVSSVIIYKKKKFAV